MNLDEMHNLLVNHYKRARKNKKNAQVESVVRQVYKKKSQQN